ncbi:hypothetical protein CLV62_101306 [Dysgonomonas alginatilytica]|uniref:Uncharacterized protein n=1 Tax=Dysgonomonas alginatilytica TaxID=1605892 RepID=A0A2V3PTI1_9BACT|nr:hypothetical protein [Dysgonomonas alginatilytica]PXV69037.1 hypothetical protein CLV62_101306 [Dysgonomonas alginatilytica]
MKKFLLLLICSVLINTLPAQVGINTESPDEKAILEIVNSEKGILIPRMTEAQRDEIKPTSVNQQSLLIFNTDEDCFNYWHKIEKEWKSLCGKIGKAIFTINCDAVKVAGEYKNGEALGGANYVTVIVHVTKPGTYSIAATVTDPKLENGYYFTTSGEFLSTGTYTIIVPGMGTPAKYTTPNKDNFTLALNGVRVNGEESACTFDVEVKNSAIKPRYTMTCSGTKVFGEYYEEQALNGSHYIEVVLAVESTSFGATYEIETNEVDGIKFKGSGVLTSSPQTVRLQGEGVPFANTTKKMYIKSNSESSTATCLANVYIIIPPKRILTIGNATLYGYNFGNVGAASNKMITDPLNFGPLTNSIVRYSGFKNKGTAFGSNNWNGTDDGRTIINMPDAYANVYEADLALLLTTGKAGFPPVDIVSIGYDYAITASVAQKLAAFVNNGGILLACCESQAGNQNLLRAIFNKQDITTVNGGANNPPGAIYQFESKEDPILNGPFGNIGGLYWGEDITNTYYATNLPLDEVVLYTSNKNINSTTSVAIPNAATAFRHRTLPFVWVGDGGFNSNDNNVTTDGTLCPFRLRSKTISGTTYLNFPGIRENYGSPSGITKYPVYNAIFTANAIAWCIKTADELKRSQKEQ